MKLNILLIDDSEVDNYISQYVIEDANLAKEITIKNSAVAALDYLKNVNRIGSEFPDLIFLDINMPRMNGFEFLDALTTLPESRTGKCSVAMLTSSLSPDDREKAMQSPYVKYFFIKPLNEKTLMEVTR